MFLYRNELHIIIYDWRSLPEIDGLSKETVLTSWMAKFDCILKGHRFASFFCQIFLFKIFILQVWAMKIQKGHRECNNNR